MGFFGSVFSFCGLWSLLLCVCWFVVDLVFFLITCIWLLVLRTLVLDLKFLDFGSPHCLKCLLLNVSIDFCH